MAKGNLFLGYGRGKIGDVVLTRDANEQVSRPRNRHPKNPKTEKQMYQRAVMATVMQMYKAGKEIFDHSFQGKQVALGSMQRFMSVNAKKLRENIVSDIANNAVTCAVVSPGAVSPVPYAYRISEGTMPQGFFKADLDENGKAAIFINEPNDVIIKDVLTPGDIYTIVAIKTVGSSLVGDLISPATIFGFVRLTVREDLPVTELADTELNDAFIVENYNLNIDKSWYLDGRISALGIFGSENGEWALGVIRSREDSGLRSTAEMVCNDPQEWGISAWNIPEVWNASVQPLGKSSLILEGGDGNLPGRSPDPA